MSTASDLSVSAGHEPSPGPDERALFSRLAVSMARHRRVVILVWLVVTVAAAPLAITLTTALSGAGWDAKGSTAEQVRIELRRDFAALGAENPIVVYRQDTPIADDPSGLRALEAELTKGPRVLSVADPLAMPAEAGMISPDGLTALIPVEQQIGEDKDRPEAAGELGSFVGALTIADGGRAEVTGEWPVWADFNSMNEAALHKAELLSGLPTLIMLFVAFGAMLAAGIPLILAISGIATGFAALHLLSVISPISVWSMNFSMMIGLAVGIDYSLFIVSRYREERIEGKDALQAIENAMSTSGKAVFLSALTVVLSLAAVFLVPVMVFQTMALGMIISVVAVALAALTLLPAVLVAMGDKVLIARNKKDPDIVAEGRWARWTGAALRRPGRTLTVGLVLLGALALPAFGMKLGMPGARVVDPGHTSRDGYDMVVESFGPGAAGPAYVTVDAADAEQVIAIAEATDNVVDARVVAPPAETGRVVVRVVPGTQIDEAATADMVEALRGPAGHGGAERQGRRTGGSDPRPHQRARRPCPLRHRRHPGRGVPVAAGGVPQRGHRHVLDPDEPAHRRRRVRVRHPRVPARLRRLADRHRAPRLRRRLGAAVLLRPAVRPVDGLPAVPARRDQGALPGHRRHPPSHP